MPVSFDSIDAVALLELPEECKRKSRWALCTPPPGHGDISDFEREAAAELGIHGVDDDLGFRNLWYETEQDARSVAMVMMRKRPSLQIWVSGPDGQTYAPLAHTVVLINTKI
jgi:hypothetical protein